MAVNAVQAIGVEMLVLIDMQEKLETRRDYYKHHFENTWNAFKIEYASKAVEPMEGWNAFFPDLAFWPLADENGNDPDEVPESPVPDAEHIDDIDAMIAALQAENNHMTSGQLDGGWM